MRETLRRRSLLKGVGTAAITMTLAGCGGSSDTGGGDTGGGDTSGDGGGDGESGSQFLASEPNYDGWLEGVDNYDRTRDLTGQDTVTISVGAGSDGLAFAPPAVAVSPDTTVVWEWTGQGGSHNVAGENRDFESEIVSEAGHTFERTFSEPGVIKYYCTPHRALGMKGAIMVQ
ncbi:MAG: halocyanin domain-containing protein [Haloarculaceae archaeon]